MYYQVQQRKIRQNSIFNISYKETALTDDSDCSHDSSTPVKYLNSNPKKQKLELCKKFMQFGSCPYYSRCKFAHGSHELRKNNQANLRYKTKECGTFFQEGHCHYGYRCNFLHKQKYVEKNMTTNLTLVILQNFGIEFLTQGKQINNLSKLDKVLGQKPDIKIRNF